MNPLKNMDTAPRISDMAVILAKRDFFFLLVFMEYLLE
jgi:hypothetical protein